VASRRGVARELDAPAAIALGGDERLDGVDARIEAMADFWNKPENAIGKKLLEVQDKGVYMAQGHDIGVANQLEARWVPIATDLRAGQITVPEAAKRAEDEFTKQRNEYLKM
jgi:hypothetical protein